MIMGWSAWSQLARIIHVLVVPPLTSMVTDNDHNGIFVELALLEHLEHLADLPIHASDHLVVARLAVVGDGILSSPL